MAIYTTNTSLLTEEIKTHLDEEKYKEALLLPNNENFAKDLKNTSWDLIPLLLSRIDNNTIMIKPSLQQCCEELLHIIVDKSNPEEVLLELIEQIEIATNDAQFMMIIRPLNAILKKLTVKRGCSLEWCLNALSSYIEKLPLPENILVEGKQRIIMDSDSSVRRIQKVYSYLPIFYQSLIDEILTSKDVNNLRKLLTSFLIGCLAKPIIAVDLDYDENTKSEARVSVETIFQDICLLEKDLFLLLKYVEYKADRESKKDLLEEDTNDVYLNSDKLTLCSLGGLYYFFLCENAHIPSMIPQIYNPEYIFHKALVPAIHLLTYSEYSIIFKGIKLVKSLLSRLSPPISYILLDCPVHKNLCDKLVAVAVYCPAETIRKETVSLVAHYVNKFDYIGRTMLIKCLLNIANHSGMIGYAITLFKNVLAEALNSNTPLPTALCGVQLRNILKLICNLPQGAESDLVELADQIISALNLLRFLAMRDTDNRTGFKESYPIIETIFIEPLRQGLYLSKAHYEVKLNDMKNSKKCMGEINIELNVGGNILNDIPIHQKKRSHQFGFKCISFDGEFARTSSRMYKSLLHGLRICRPNFMKIAGVPEPLRQFSSEKIGIVSDNNKATAESHLDDQKYEDHIRVAVLTSALTFINKHGWSTDAIVAGAEAIGYPGTVHGLFQNGAGDLISFISSKCNQELVEQIKTWPAPPTDSQKVPIAFLEKAIMTRLLMIEPYKKIWSKAMAMQAMPGNVKSELSSTLHLVDDICYFSGDRSVDINWYTRRLGLVGIYKATELFFLTDESQDYNATRQFLTARLNDAEFLQSALNLGSSTAPTLPFFSALASTVRNILGINRRPPITL